MIRRLILLLVLFVLGALALSFLREHPHDDRKDIDIESAVDEVRDALKKVAP